MDRHLFSKDFFATKLFPSAKLDITDVKKSSQDGAYDVEANLSINGISKKINFTV